MSQRVEATSVINAWVTAVEQAYRDGQTDYWLSPMVLADKNGPIGRIQARDAVIFCCRRGEREIQLTRAFVDDSFAEFSRRKLDPLTFVPLTLYHPDLHQLLIAFAPQDVSKTLGEVVSDAGLAQLRLAEQEKFSHVTYFFSGGRSTPFTGEVDRVVPSHLDDPPGSLPQLVSTLEEEVGRNPFALIVVNVATGDIMGHYLELEPKLRCSEASDRALGELLEIAHQHEYWAAITADHGLLEDHGPEGGPVNVSHTTNPVPFVLINPVGKTVSLRPGTALCDVAPTLLSILGLPHPEEMTGQSLAEQRPPNSSRVMLVVLDGWGLGKAERIDPIKLATTPTWDRLCRGPYVSLQASGEAVGLLPSRKGNSEAGHMNLGAGRPVCQDDVRIEDAIQSGRFAENSAFHVAIGDAINRNGSLHLIGLLSEKSSHGSMDYVFALLKLAKRKGLERVYVHWITDGRSTPPGSAPDFLRRAGETLAKIGIGTLGTLVGRGLALDRSGNYEEKTQPVYRALASGEGHLVRET